MLSMFQLQFLLQGKSSTLIFETIFEKVSQFGFMLIHAYFQAMFIFKQALIIARVRYLNLFQRLLESCVSFVNLKKNSIEM